MRREERHSDRRSSSAVRFDRDASLDAYRTSASRDALYNLLSQLDNAAPSHARVQNEA